MNFDLRIKELTHIYDTFSEHDDDLDFPLNHKTPFFVTNDFESFADVDKLKLVDYLTEVDWSKSSPFRDNKGNVWKFATPISNISYNRFVMFTKARMDKMPWDRLDKLRIRNESDPVEGHGMVFTVKSYNDIGATLVLEDGREITFDYLKLFVKYKLCVGGIWMPFGFDTEEDFEETVQ